MRTLLLILSLCFFANVGHTAKIVADSVRINKSTLPTECPDGELRVDTTSDTLKKCLSNTWEEISGAGSTYSLPAAETIAEGDIVYNKVERLLSVTSTNNWLEITDGALDVDIEFTPTDYLIRDLATDDATHDLAKLIEDQINASTLSGFTVDYAPTTRDFTFTNPSTSFSIKCATGSHGSAGTDDHICTLLGFDDTSDTTTSTSVTTSSTVDFSISKNTYARLTDTTFMFSSNPHGVASAAAAKKASVSILMSGTKDGYSLDAGERYYTTSTSSGALMAETGTSTDPYASAVGFSSDGANLIFNLIPGLVKSPSDWLSSPLVHDQGGEIQLGCQHINGAGYGIRVFIDNPASTSSTYIIEYKNPGLLWASATTSVSKSDGASTLNLGENFAGDYRLMPRCFVDSNNYGLIGLLRETASNRWAAYAYSSTDLNTWVGTQVLAHATNFSYVHDIVARENKAVIVTNYTGVTNIQTSDNSGSGYTSWGSSTNISSALNLTRSASLHIQYFPDEPVTKDKYRIVLFGTRSSDGYNYYHYFAGDMTGETSAQTISTTATHMMWASARDQIGNGNVIMAVYARDDSAANTVHQIETTDSASTFSVNNHSIQNLNSGGSNVTRYNGYSSETADHWMVNTTKRAVLIGSRAYVIIQTEANPSSGAAAILLHTNNITSGTWETSQNVGQTTAHNQESWIQYISADNALLFGFKYNTNSRASNLTSGQQWVRYIELVGNDLSLHDLVQIDGGKSMTNFLGFSTGDCWADGCGVSYEEYGGAYDFLETNFFQ